MRKNAFSRYIWILCLYCAVFVFLVVVQFARTGNFSLRIGDMQINGRFFIPTVDEEYINEYDNNGFRQLDGAASVFFGGLEFRLTSHSAGATAGFSLIDTEGNSREIFPEYISVEENGAVFALPGGSKLSFINANSNSDELIISGNFGDKVAGIDIPFRPQRSSVILNNAENGLNISFGGSRFGFNRATLNQESGRLVLSSAVPSVSYRVIPDIQEIKPEDFFVSRTETPETLNEALSQWTNSSFTWWRQNMPAQADEDMVIAWCAEAIRRGVYNTASSVIPASFSGGPGRTWESAVYQFDRRTGMWERAVASIASLDREKTNRISGMLQRRDSAVFLEDNLIEYLTVRSLNNLIGEAFLLAAATDHSDITLEMAPGILECRVETDRLRPGAANPFEPLAEAALPLIADGLRRDGDRVFVFINGVADIEFNVRLGKTLEEWAVITGKENWARVGRSLVLSVISSAGGDGSVPVSVTIGPDRGFAPSTARISSAKLYRFMGLGEHAPRWVATGIDGIWAYTAASSVSITRDDRQMVISARFPPGETHQIMLANVRPFPLLQIHDMNWRRAATFESYYNSSGWNYFEREQILVLKIRHRTAVEQVRILFTVPRPPPPPPPPTPPEEETPATEEAPEVNYEGS